MINDSFRAILGTVNCYNAPIVAVAWLFADVKGVRAPIFIIQDILNYECRKVVGRTTVTCYLFKCKNANTFSS